MRRSAVLVTLAGVAVLIASCAEGPQAPDPGKLNLERFTCDDGGSGLDLSGPCGGVGFAGPDTAYVTWNWNFPGQGLTPTNLRGGGPPWPNMPVDTIIDLFVHVDSIGRGFLANRTVTLTLAPIDEAGGNVDGPYGHIHRGADGVAKPVGGFLPGNAREVVLNTGNSPVIIRYRTGPVSGPVIMRGVSEGAKPAVDTVPVGVVGLVSLVQRTSDTLIGKTTSHTDNHYVVGTMVTMLDDLADSMRAQFSIRLFYNDCSLARGGVFDFRFTWEAPHSEHRAGRDCDLRTGDRRGIGPVGSLSPRQQLKVD